MLVSSYEIKNKLISIKEISNKNLRMLLFNVSFYLVV